MRKKGRIKYIFVMFLCFLIFIYGFTEVNITKAKNLREKSKFTMDLTLNPMNVKVETANYVFYFNNAIIGKMKEKYDSVFDDIYNGIFSK